MSLSPCLRSSALDRIAGLLALETSDLQRQPPSVGLLDEASIERGEHLSAYHALRVDIWRMVNPASFHLVGSQTTPVDAVHPKTSVERFTSLTTAVAQATVPISYHLWVK